VHRPSLSSPFPRGQDELIFPALAFDDFRSRRQCEFSEDLFLRNAVKFCDGVAFGANQFHFVPLQEISGGAARAVVRALRWRTQRVRAALVRRRMARVRTILI